MKKWNNYLAIAVIVLFIFSGNCNAEPDATVNYLLNDVMTMFDFGIYRMGKLLEYEAKNQDFMSSVSYDWNENRLTLRLKATRPKILKKSLAKADCRAIIIAVEKRFTIHNMNWCFTHLGFDRPSQPEEIGRKMFNITDIDLTYRYRNNKSTMKCNTALNSSDIQCSE